MITSCLIESTNCYKRVFCTHVYLSTQNLVFHIKIAVVGTLTLQNKKKFYMGAPHRTNFFFFRTQPKG
jgi:hypothetical protein